MSRRLVAVDSSVRHSMDNDDRRRLVPAHRILQCPSPCYNPGRRALYTHNRTGKKEGNCKLGYMVSPRPQSIFNASFLYNFFAFSKLTKATNGSEAQRALGYNDLCKKFKPEVQDWIKNTVRISMYRQVGVVTDRGETFYIRLRDMSENYWMKHWLRRLVSLLLALIMVTTIYYVGKKTGMVVRESSHTSRSPRQWFCYRSHEHRLWKSKMIIFSIAER